MLAGQELDVGEVERLVSPSDGVVLDVGAERGEISSYFAGCGFRVIAFEPSRHNSRALRILCIRYLVTRRIRLVRAACGLESGAGTLGGRGSWALKLGQAGEEVRVLQLAQWIRAHSIPQVAVLKIDAEGSDLEILRGYFAGEVPLPIVIMFEFSDGELDEARRLLRSQGFIHERFICRWNEQPGRSSQPRLAVVDGYNQTVRSAEWGNAIFSQRPFRVMHPLESSDS